MAAMEAGDYSTAVAKFEGAYQLAPDRHAFNYNIASAAELAGDCRKAKTHYKMFLDLVAEHEARSSAKKTLEKLTSTCVEDEESTEQLTFENRATRDSKREVEEADRAILEALAETRLSASFYAAVAAKHGGKQPFRRIAKAKARQVKRIEKLVRDHDIAGEPRPIDPLQVPADIDDACERGASQEIRNAELYDKVFDMFEASDIVRVMDRFARKSELRFSPAFRDNCPQ